jgi:hypothetical protein
MLFILLISPWTALAKNSADQLFDEAGSAYSKGDYKHAVELYEEITKNYGYSPGVLYNLANSYAASGRIGKAVLNYERAVRLAPGDSDIINNLQVVKTREGLFEREQTMPERLRNLLSMNQWSLLALAALAVSTAMVFLRFYKTVSRNMAIAINSLSVVALFLSVYCAYSHYRGWDGYIVISPESRLMISPFTGAASAGDIQPGRKVFIIEKHGDFNYVQDEGGRKGWLPGNVFEPIIPQKG